MALFKDITAKIFKSSEENRGLSVSLDELIKMRRYVNYVKPQAAKKTSSLLAGDVKSAFKGRGLEFEEIRGYAFGDDVRDMDWRVTARRNEPYIKVFQEERDREIYVLLDFSASMVFGTKKELKSVFAAKTAALIGWVALENRDRFGCIIYDGDQSYVFKAKSGVKNLLAILNTIAKMSVKILQNPHEGNFGKALKITEKTIKNQGNIFILSDFSNFDNNIKNALFALSQKGELYMLAVSDELEINPPKKGEYMAEYAGQQLVFNTYSADFIENYKAYFENKRHNIREFALKTKSPYVELKNGTDISSQIKFA